jgi:hypothetical protein
MRCSGEGDAVTLDALKADVTTPGRPLTEEMLIDFCHKIRPAEEEYAKAPCGSGARPHLVTVTAVTRGGWTMCANCLATIWLEPEED